MEKSIEIEKLSRQQRENKLWFQYREKRITSVAHKIFIRQKNFETLVTSLHTPNDNLPKSVQSAFKHGIKNKILAKEKYVKATNFKLFRNIVTEDTGLLIQPNLPWLGASPDGKVLDQHEIPSEGLLEIKCPYLKRDCDIHELVRTNYFYICLDENEMSYLKKKHSLAYYT